MSVYSDESDDQMEFEEVEPHGALEEFNNVFASYRHTSSRMSWSNFNELVDSFEEEADLAILLNSGRKLDASLDYLPADTAITVQSKSDIDYIYVESKEQDFLSFLYTQNDAANIKLATKDFSKNHIVLARLSFPPGSLYIYLGEDPRKADLFLVLIPKQPDAASSFGVRNCQVNSETRRKIHLVLYKALTSNGPSPEEVQLRGRLRSSLNEADALRDFYREAFFQVQCSNLEMLDRLFAQAWETNLDLSSTFDYKTVSQLMGQHHHLNEGHEYFRLLGQTYNIEKLSRVAISPAWNLFGYVEETRAPISFLATEKFAREIAPRGVTFYPKGFSKYGSLVITSKDNTFSKSFKQTLAETSHLGERCAEITRVIVYSGIKQTFRSKRSEEPFYNMAEIKACLEFKGKLVENRIELEKLKEMVDTCTANSNYIRLEATVMVNLADINLAARNWNTVKEISEMCSSAIEPQVQEVLVFNLGKNV